MLLLAGTGHGAELSEEVVTRAGSQGCGLGSGLLAEVGSSAHTRDKAV